LLFPFSFGPQKISEPIANPALVTTVAPDFFFYFLKTHLCGNEMGGGLFFRSDAADFSQFPFSAKLFFFFIQRTLFERRATERGRERERGRGRKRNEQITEQNSLQTLNNFPRAQSTPTAEKKSENSACGIYFYYNKRPPLSRSPVAIDVRVGG
jgi:hypothetical protein